MKRLFTGMGVGFVAGVWLRHHQHQFLTEALGGMSDGVSGVLGAINGLDVEGTVELSLAAVWDRTFPLRSVNPQECTPIETTANRIADLCRLTAAEAMSRTLTSVSFGAELGPVTPLP